MLTDIFADRYSKRVIWETYSQTESKLLMQTFRIIDEQLMPPYWVDGKENPAARSKWSLIHERLSMELGVEQLSPRYFSYPTYFNGKQVNQTATRSIHDVCKNFMTAKFEGESPDRFIKERISFVELAFRLREEELVARNQDLPARIAAAQLEEKLRSAGLRLPGSHADGLKAQNASNNLSFRQAVEELNERFRRAGAFLNYHNGFIQISRDELVQTQVENPFWEAVSDPLWKNVDIDMKEALDRRDANERDPALYAAKALESVIKIISDQKRWTHGGEKGAHGYINNLGSAKNGNLIADWEREALKAFFTAVRNPLGHGPGGETMPELTPSQTDWAIETCMSWVKTLIARL